MYIFTMQLRNCRCVEKRVTARRRRRNDQCIKKLQTQSKIIKIKIKSVNLYILMDEKLIRREKCVWSRQTNRYFTFAFFFSFHSIGVISNEHAIYTLHIYVAYTLYHLYIESASSLCLYFSCFFFNQISFDFFFLNYKNFQCKRKNELPSRHKL